MLILKVLNHNELKTPQDKFLETSYEILVCTVHIPNKALYYTMVNDLETFTIIFTSDFVATQKGLNYNGYLKTFFFRDLSQQT